MGEKRLFSWKVLVLALIGVALLATGCNVPALQNNGGGGTATAGGGGGPLPASNGANGYGPVNTITVTGTGQANGEPDVAYLQLGIDLKDADVAAAVNRSNTVIDGIMSALEGQGIARLDMQTVGFNVWQEEIYDPQSGPTGEMTFHVNNTLSIVIRDITKVGSVIEAGIGAGATNVYGLTFGIDDTTSLEDQARTAAVEDAQARAEKLAESLGVTLGKPTIASEYSGSGAISAYDAAAYGLGGGGGGAPPISEGQMTVSMTVNVTYAISQ